LDLNASKQILNFIDDHVDYFFLDSRKK